MEQKKSKKKNNKETQLFNETQESKTKTKTKSGFIIITSRSSN
jgi:hypothetical protein